MERDECEWYEDYLQLRAEGVTWRKAVYIAWASSPASRRWPSTLDKLAQEVLGLKSGRTIRKWREKDPTIDLRIEKMQASPLLRHRRDVYEALVTVAATPDPRGNADRKLYFQLVGTPGNEQEEAEDEFYDIGDDELAAVEDALKVAFSSEA
jgi:hypothetical protein